MRLPYRESQEDSIVPWLNLSSRKGSAVKKNIFTFGIPLIESSLLARPLRTGRWLPRTIRRADGNTSPPRMISRNTPWKLILTNGVEQWRASQEHTRERGICFWAACYFWHLWEFVSNRSLAHGLSKKNVRRDTPSGVARIVLEGRWATGDWILTVSVFPNKLKRLTLDLFST